MYRHHLFYDIWNIYVLLSILLSIFYFIIRVYYLILINILIIIIKSQNIYNYKKEVRNAKILLKSFLFIW